MKKLIVGIIIAFSLVAIKPIEANRHGYCAEVCGLNQQCYIDCMNN